jgi:hypothetical protein
MRIGNVCLLPFAATALSSPRLRVQPLIGGPTWLKVHVQVCVSEELTCDFIPLDATNDATLGRLVTLQGVPGVVRMMGTVGEARPSQRAKSYCDNYESTQLHLVSNNCWTFALGLLWHLQTEDTLKEI